MKPLEKSQHPARLEACLICEPFSDTGGPQSLDRVPPGRLDSKQLPLMQIVSVWTSPAPERNTYIYIYIYHIHLYRHIHIY